ncbi:hypothetical protein ACIBOV_24455, partial [Micromonospora chersina]|uniref:hypothetical protein n=1 Tax=Micromonospora chersina TaxID=47854 RepID=UPI0037965AA8
MGLSDSGSGDGPEIQPPRPGTSASASDAGKTQNRSLAEAFNFAVKNTWLTTPTPAWQAALKTQNRSLMEAFNFAAKNTWLTTPTP